MLVQVVRPVAVGFVPGEAVLAGDDGEGEVEVGRSVADPLLAQALLLLVLKASADALEGVEEEHGAHGVVEVRFERFAEVFGEVVDELVADFLGGHHAQFGGDVPRIPFRCTSKGRLSFLSVKPAPGTLLARSASNSTIQGSESFGTPCLWRSMAKAKSKWGAGRPS